jgi:hypothetical protein
MMYVRLTSALAAATLLTFVSHAQAQSLPPEGEVHVTFTATQVPPVNPMPIGDGKQYLQVNYIMSASNDQGNAVQLVLSGVGTTLTVAIACPFWRVVRIWEVV